MPRLLRLPVLSTFAVVLFVLTFSSCARVKKGVSETVEWTFPKILTAPFMDAKTDTTTGALKTKGKPEAEKEAEAVESEQTAERSLRDIRRRDRKEEEDHVHRAITDDIKVEQQVQRTQ